MNEVSVNGLEAGAIEVLVKRYARLWQGGSFPPTALSKALSVLTRMVI